MGLFSFLRPKNIKSFAEVSREIDHHYDQGKQGMEDWKVKNYIEREASLWYFEYTNSPVWIIDGVKKRVPGIMIACPRMSVYMIYHRETAKYLNADITKLINERFKELMTEKGDPTLETTPAAFTLPSKIAPN